MRTEKEIFPKVLRHPRGERTSNEQTACYVFPHRKPIHYEIVARRSDSFARGDALPKRAVFHAHVHFGVSFHFAFHASIGLLSCLVYQFTRKKNAEKYGHNRHHQWSTSKFRQGKLPAY